ncbi:protein phosphatase 2C domain-containing protein [Streptomyces sp. NPDC087420]|uniref:protein phosphatase 2C domain-containing protein n=1 Tax=Streptomyces sp. NPDC087420 TaxID=3365785 RepID=UPI0038391526
MIVAGAGVPGAARLAAGQGGQDAFRAVDLGGRAVLAVADGVGTRARSALGAHLAVDAACQVLAEDPPDTSAGAARWTRWIASRGVRVVDAWLRAAHAVQGPDGDPGALGAALAAAVVRPPWAVFLSVGDCFAVVLTREHERRGGRRYGAGRPERCHLVLPPPDPDLPPPGFLSSPGARLRVRTFALWDPELSGVVLATDGCAPPALDHPSARGLPLAAGPLPSARFFHAVSARLREDGGDAGPLRDLLSAAATGRTGDDVTVLCALTEGE